MGDIDCINFIRIIIGVHLETFYSNVTIAYINKSL